jgi:peroxidase
LNFFRSARLPTSSPRGEGFIQILNTLSPVIDITAIYGTSKETESVMRSFTDGLLNTTIMEYGEFPFVENSRFFKTPAGIVSLSPVISSIFTVLIREHNRKAKNVQQEEPGLSDEEIFQRSKQWVIAIVQRILFEQVKFRVTNLVSSRVIG